MAVKLLVRMQLILGYPISLPFPFGGYFLMVSNLKRNFMASFYTWGSTVSWLFSHYKEKVYFSPEVPGTHLIDLRTMKNCVQFGTTQWI